MSTKSLFTIGHSAHPIEKFLGLLKLHGVKVLVDIRSHPMSRFHPHFNKKSFEAALVEEGIEYVFLGKELGGKPDGPQFYDEDGYALYWMMAETDKFHAGIDRVEALVDDKKPVVIMCSEEDPAGCHRRLLVGKALLEKQLILKHIRANGSIEEESEEERGQLSLFQDQNRQLWRSQKPVLKK